MGPSSRTVTLTVTESPSRFVTVATTLVTSVWVNVPRISKSPADRNEKRQTTQHHVIRAPESTIKQINRRVKGSEKFWSHGAEPLLQLAADYLSETTPLTTFWRDRPALATGQRHYQSAG